MQHTEGTIPGPRGAQLFVQAWRPAAPRAAIALCHGLGEHSGRYANLAAAATPRGYAIYACDHLGHGRSPGQRGFIAAWEDLRAGVRSLVAHAAASEPGLPVFLFGHSLGGLIALEYAIREPAGLRGVAVSAPALSSEGLSPVLLAASRVLSRIWPTLQLKTGLRVDAIARDPAVVAAYRADPLVHGLGTPRLATESMQAIARVFAHAGDLRLPLLIVHGEADAIVPPTASARFFECAGSADKRRRAYQGVFHEPHNDYGWEQATQDIIEWLESQLRISGT